MLLTLQYLYKSIQPLETFKIFPYQSIVLNNKKCYLFEPNHPSKKTIIIIKGMTVRGIDDPRLLKQAEILRQLGYKVYLPQYLELQNLEITPHTLNQIHDDIKEIQKHNPISKLSLFSVSFSGALSLIVTSREDLKIDSILLIGTFADFHKTIEFLLLNLHIDPYGFFIVLKNFIEEIPKYKNYGLKEAFHLAAVDNALKREPPLLNLFFESHPKTKKVFFEIYNNLELRKYIFKKILSTEKFQKFCNELNTLKYIKNCKARISLLHGKHDNVIPPEESLSIYTECTKYNIPVKLAITSLLDHGNVSGNLNLVKEFYQLINTLNFFFQ